MIDPEQTIGLEQFKKANADYIEQIKNTRARGGEEIRIPGGKAGKEKQAKEAAGIIEIPEELWREIKALG